MCFFFFSSRRRHTRSKRDWSSTCALPILIPEVNPDHVKLLECQAWRRKSGGFVVTNPNCSAIGLVMALAPRSEEHTSELQSRFDLVCRLLLEKKKRYIRAENIIRTEICVT